MKNVPVLTPSEIEKSIKAIVKSANLYQIVQDQKFWGTVELSFKEGKLTVVKTIVTTLPQAADNE